MTNKQIFDDKIKFNDITKHSNLALDLISNNRLKFREKSKKEVLREYELEKWKDIYERTKKLKTPRLKEVESLHQNPNELSSYFYNDKFFVSQKQNINKYYIDLYFSFIKPYIKEASSIVELGAGYGSKIIGLSQINEIKKKPLFGFELTANGCSTMDLIAKHTDLNLTTGFCDFENENIGIKDLPKRSIIFTSYSLHYLPELTIRLIKNIRQLKPLIVIHFEPIYQLYENKTLHHEMCKKYFELNDYTKNILSIIKEAGEKKFIAIRKIEPNIFGSNPFMPISVIEWKPLFN